MEPPAKVMSDNSGKITGSVNNHRLAAIFLIAVGIAMIAVALAADFVGLGDPQQFGLIQMMMAVAGFAVLLGGTVFINNQKSPKAPQQTGTKGLKILPVVLGLLLVLIALSYNKWFIERFWSPDGDISSVFIISMIVILQICGIASGLWFFLKRPVLSVPHTTNLVAVFGLAAGVLFGGYGNLRLIEERELDEVWRTLNESEELILLLMPKLQGLDKSVMNLRFPDHESYDLFEQQVRLLDLSDAGPPSFFEEFLPTTAVGIRKWPPAAEVRSVAVAEVRMWKPFLDGVAYFENARFEINKGHFLNEVHDDYETEILFSGTARMKSGQISAIKNLQTVRWKRQPESVGDTTAIWQIYDWRTHSFESVETDQKLFAEVLDQAIVNREVLERARTSIHERLVVEMVLDKENFKKPHKEFSSRAFSRHPGLAVVDLDRDGFDDLYVMARWGENMFFHNRGDGTFEEIAADLGLNIKDHTSSALFADFDNDGDDDVLLGRTLARSVYLVNEDGRFVDRSDELVSGLLPYLVSSISAVDYNDDGLLDIYISTYENRMIRRYMRKRPSSRGKIPKDLPLDEYLAPEDAKQLYQLLYHSADWRPFTNHHGPPNVLLRNIGGGRFEIDKESTLSAVFRQSFQSVWSDFDNDGDPDVYIANDFGPNKLMRNDGNGQFVEVTGETGTADVGFGMGAAWGDYNNDGNLDLYVTNMYSKAGLRITQQLPGLGKEIAQSARGNSLFQQIPGRFLKVSGLTAPDVAVEKGGWGWGSQFVDVDNDGYLDIYAPSGNYTAPKEIAIPGDT